MKDHIHTPDDGRGFREVWLDGKKIDNVFFADTKRGIIDRYQTPCRPEKYRKRLISERLRGTVEVKILNP